MAAGVNGARVDDSGKLKKPLTRCVAMASPRDNVSRALHHPLFGPRGCDATVDPNPTIELKFPTMGRLPRFSPSWSPPNLRLPPSVDGGGSATWNAVQRQAHIDTIPVRLDGTGDAVNESLLVSAAG